MIIFYPGYTDPFYYKDTEHECPTCGQVLKIVLGSTMLVCSNDADHGPYFLV